jgi:hypothetical protein
MNKHRSQKEHYRKAPLKEGTYGQAPLTVGKLRTSTVDRRNVMDKHR